MQGLFTDAWLGTLTGSAAATVLIVDFLRGLLAWKRFPTRFVVLAVAEGVVVLAALAVGPLTVKNIPFYLLNGFLVAALAVGRRQGVRRRLGRPKARPKAGQDWGA